MLELDPNDPFDKLIIPIVETNRAKRKDYAKDGDIFSNFRGVAKRVGHNDPLQAVEHLIATKEERLAALAHNQRAPENETVLDTYLDRAVYAIISYGLACEAAGFFDDGPSPDNEPQGADPMTPEERARRQAYMNEIDYGDETG